MYLATNENIKDPNTRILGWDGVEDDDVILVEQFIKNIRNINLRELRISFYNASLNYIIDNGLFDEHLFVNYYGKEFELNEKQINFLFEHNAFCAMHYFTVNNRKSTKCEDIVFDLIKSELNEGEFEINSFIILYEYWKKFYNKRWARYEEFLILINDDAYILNYLKDIGPSILKDKNLMFKFLRKLLIDDDGEVGTCYWSENDPEEDNLLNLLSIYKNKRVPVIEEFISIHGDERLAKRYFMIAKFKFKEILKF